MIHSILTNPTIYNITQTTQAQVAIETSLKAVGRPGFILLDNNIDKNTKKYSSMKEFLYQITCLGVSLGFIIPIFKKNSFSIARKLFKDDEVFKAFKTSDEFNKFHKLSQDEKIKYLDGINKNQKTDFKLENINEDRAKGMIECTSIAGSMLGLSILSPLISRPFIRPVLKAFGADTQKNYNKKPNKIDINI